MHQVGSAVLVGAHAGSLRSRLLAPRGYLVRREIEEIDLVGDGAEVVLTSRPASRGDHVGVWFVTRFGSLPLPLEETI